MNIRSTIFLALYFFLSGVAHSQSNPLLGVWKSDEEKTLTTIEKAEKPSEKGLKILKDGFFGRLIVEFRENDTRSYFVEDENA
nr:hypothetical protein [Granulosicoccus sp.]